MYLPIPDPDGHKPLLCKADPQGHRVMLQNKGARCEIDFLAGVVRYFRRDAVRPYQTLDLDVLREKQEEALVREVG